jgi:predicted dehydrogenase
MATKKVRVGVIGAGAWACGAHIPGWLRDGRELIARGDIDVIDICTPSHTHFDLAWAALEANKHVLCEKPVAYDFRDTLRAAELARSKGLKTKLGFTFRYSPAMRYMKALIDQGYVGTPYIFNGYEQNSQWINPQTPLRQVDPDADQSVLQVSSLEGYGAPIIDLGHWFVGAGYDQVVGTMRNFVPERVVRQTGKMQRANIDDGDIFIGEFTNGVLGSVQTSFVTVGNYPGLEARVYGSEGALICRLVEEFGSCETLKGAKPDDVEFKDIPVPPEYYPDGSSSRESWRTLFYANLIRGYLDEILADDDRNEGNFVDGARVQEVINAVELSFRERRWVKLPLGD